MTTIKVKNSKVFHALEEQVWKIISDDFVNVYQWSKAVRKSVPLTNLEKRFTDAPAAGRICTVDGFGELTEVIVHYDKAKKEITWDAKSTKLPGFVSYIENAISVTRTQDGKTDLNSVITIELTGFVGWVMAPFIKNNFNKAIAGFFRDLDRHLDNQSAPKNDKPELVANS